MHLRTTAKIEGSEKSKVGNRDAFQMIIKDKSVEKEFIYNSFDFLRISWQAGIFSADIIICFDKQTFGSLL